MSSGADSEHNTQLAVPANNSTAPEISESDFELIEETRLGVFFLSSNQRRGVLAEKLFSQSKNHCLRQFSSRSEMDSCVILYVRPESRMGIANFEDRLRNLPSLWLRDDFVAIYTLDPDNSTERRRPDELFVTDCNFFSKSPEIEWIICKSSPEDPISNEIAREKKMEAERKKAAEAMAADAQAAANEAAADAMGEPF